MWFDKKNPAAVFIDRRPEVAPDLVADSRALPLAAGMFDLLVFDPPHLNFGARSVFAQKYGHYSTREILQLVAETAAESWRVAAGGAVLAFKWNDHDIALPRVVALMAPYWEPLFGSVIDRAKTKTYWVMFRRRPAPGVG
jgi:hypothetical protein